MTSPTSESTGPTHTPPLYVGVDVGGTSIKLGVVDSLGRSLAKVAMPTQEEQGPAVALRRCADTALDLVRKTRFDWDDVRAIGLATPGTMDLPKGLILQPHNLPHWWNFPARDSLAQATGKPVAFANDANAAAYGEFWVGRGEKASSIVMLTLGTGLGGGIIVDEMSIDGEHSHGSECGHTIIDYNETARRCGCGQRGHLEAYVSAHAVVDRTEEALRAGQVSSLLSVLAEGERLTPLSVAQAAEEGDALALDIVLETGRYLGIGIVNMMHIIDPGIVVLGGAMNFGGSHSTLGQRFLERVREEVRARAFPTLIDQTHIDFATLGGDAGYIGAAGIARFRALRDQL